MLRSAPLLLATLLLVGCGGRSGQLPWATADGGAPLDAAPLPPDRGGPDQPVGGPVEGLIGFFEYQSALSGAQQGSAFVFFTPDPMPLFSPQERFGPTCQRYPQDEVGPVQYSAGTVRIQAGAFSFELSPDKQAGPDEWLYPGMLYPDYFSAGSTVQVRADGEQIPAFQTTASGVGDLKVTFPITFARRSTAYTVTFPARSGDGWVLIKGVAGGKEVDNIRCQFDASAGRFTIPASALAALPAAATQVTLAVGLVSDTLFQPTPTVKLHLLTAHLLERTLPLLK